MIEPTFVALNSAEFGRVYVNPAFVMAVIPDEEFPEQWSKVVFPREVFTIRCDEEDRTVDLTIEDVAPVVARALGLVAE